MKVVGQSGSLNTALKHHAELEKEVGKNAVANKRMHHNKTEKNIQVEMKEQTNRQITEDNKQALQSVVQRKVTVDVELAKTIASQINEITNSSDAPVLSEPKLPASNTARVMFFLGTILKMNGENSVNQLLDNLKQLELNHLIKQSVSNALSAQLTEAKNNLDKAMENDGNLLGQLDSATSDLTTKQQMLKDAEAALNQLKPGDPGYDMAKAAVDSARTSVNEAEQKVSTLKTQQEATHSVLKNAQQAYQQVVDQAKKQSDIQIPVLAKQSGKPDKLSSAGTLAMVIGQCIEMMGELSVNKLKNDLSNSDAMQLARQKEMQKKSDEYQEKVRKAEETSKITGCLADILGGLAMIVGAITSVFGGAGVGLMAVGIGLMAADGITEAITGKSLTSMLMEPLMKYVLSPLMDIIGKIVVEIFDKTPLGLLLKAIDDATGLNMMDTIHSVVTAVAAVAVMIAIAYVAKSAGKQLMKALGENMSKLISEAVLTAIKQVVKKVVPAALKNTGKLTSKMLVKLEGSALKNMELAGQYAHLASAGTNLVGNSLVGTLQEDISRMLASLKINEASINISREQMKGFIDYFQGEQEKISAMTMSMSEALMKQQETGRVILRNMRNISA